MTGASRDALFAILDKLSPETIEDSVPSRAWLPVTGKALWNHYKEIYEEAADKDEDSLLVKQFRAAFALAYLKHFRD